MVPVAIVNILHSSVSEDKKLLSVMKIRQYVSQLLQRAVLLGSLREGVAMHDIGKRWI